MKKALYLFVVASTFVGLTFLHSLNATAGLAQTLEMPTDVGKVVLTVETCPMINRKEGFDYRAYATEKNARTGEVLIHEGCWYKDVEIVNILFYNEEPPLVATYRDYYFVPTPNI